MSLTAGILTVSDKCSQGLAQDTSGPALRNLLESNNWVVTHTDIVPDETHQITQTVEKWSQTCHLVVVSGGTGLASGDVTVEALEPLFTKKLPSLAIAMVAGSLRITPMAALSQVTAGIVNETVVVAVPGSKKGSTENLQQIIGVLPHAVDTACAGRSTRQIHNMQAPALCGCSRVDDTGSPGGVSEKLGASVAGRARKSPYPMVPADEALAMAFGYVGVLPKAIVELSAVRAGMVLAEPVVAREPVPAYRASVMDGYAVVADDGPGDYCVLGASTAGKNSAVAEMSVTSGSIMRITTGAPVPPGADAVVMVEDTQLLEASADGEEAKVRVLARVQPGQHIRPVGFDVAQGTELLSASTVISGVGGEIGTLALSGNKSFRIYAVPRIAVISTGDELTDSAEMSLQGQVRDSNRPALICALQALGCDVVDLGIVRDDPDILAATMAEALGKGCHGIITSGGVSMGERDWLRPVIEQRLDGKIVFGRVLMKPAKPTTFAMLPQGRFVFALPGNPASAVVAFHMFAAPVIRKLAGHGDRIEALRPSVRAVFCGPEELVLDHVRPEYARARLCWNSQLAVWQAEVLDSRQQSSRMASMAGANALVCLPRGSNQKPVVRNGDQITAIVIAPPAFNY
ncbi:hypothetical protein LPJ64_000024 [Coemansia asiatica]|uniref:molybdopterin adenylyltransferase n=1 Tax=Coemansia asiatica TaxID=1052880 RepID=A0A9W8CNF4_9FUNG|nr:hypothetical protein LPJ64_000024 [Coemansia asiatica]